MFHFGKNTNTTTNDGRYGANRTVWHPYVNDPSKAQRMLETFSWLIILAAVPSFLGGGIYGLFSCGYGIALGILGLFAWTRRHSTKFIISALLYIAYLIVVIVLRAVNVGGCWPYVRGTDPGLGDATDADDLDTGRFCGDDLYTYINNGVLILLTLLALLFALKVAAEKRAAYALETVTTTTTTSGTGHTVYNKPLSA